MKRSMLILATLAFLSGPRLAKAESITYTEQLIASGILGSNAFTDALVIVTFVGDTANVGCYDLLCINSIGTASIKAAGIGTATFITDTFTAFVDRDTTKVGIGDLTLDASIANTFNSAFASYDLTTAIGPISGYAFIRTDLTFPTTLGDLRFINSSGTSTFTAKVTPVPEPSTLALLIIGIVGLIGSDLKHKKRIG